MGLLNGFSKWMNDPNTQFGIGLLSSTGGIGQANRAKSNALARQKQLDDEPYIQRMRELKQKNAENTLTKFERLEDERILALEVFNNRPPSNTAGGIGNTGGLSIPEENAGGLLSTPINTPPVQGGIDTAMGDFSDVNTPLHLDDNELAANQPQQTSLFPTPQSIEYQGQPVTTNPYLLTKQKELAESKRLMDGYSNKGLPTQYYAQKETHNKILEAIHKEEKRPRTEQEKFQRDVENGFEGTVAEWRVKMAQNKRILSPEELAQRLQLQPVTNNNNTVNLPPDMEIDGDYVITLDGKGAPIMTVIPGSKTDIKQRADNDKTDTKVKEDKKTATRQKGLIVDILDQISENPHETTGFMSEHLAGWGNEAAVDVQENLKTLKAQMGFDNLVKLKAQGGTLGALSDRELELLSAKFTSLKQGQSNEQLRKNLKTLYYSILDEHGLDVVIELGLGTLAPRVKEGPKSSSPDDIVNFYLGDDKKLDNTSVPDTPVLNRGR